jgi:ureidoacrylate peracid hydrolase
VNDDTSRASIDAARSLAHVAPLTSLSDKVRPAHTALLVIDMQNDFCADTGFVAKGGRDVSLVHAMATNLPGFIDTARRAGVLIVFVRCAYSTPQNRFLSDVWLEQAARRQGGGYTLSPVCQSGEAGANYFVVQPDETDVVVTKHRYDAFHATDLDLILRANAIRTVVLTGVSTHVCVETTARAAFVRDYYTVVVSDGCAAYSVQEHEAALKVIDRFFGEVADMNTIRPYWPAKR